MEIGETLNQYGFIVDKKATKQQIKEEIERLYEVHVDRVNTMTYIGKKKYRYTKRNIIIGQKPDYKKAVVTLREGETIDFYANI